MTLYKNINYIKNLGSPTNENIYYKYIVKDNITYNVKTFDYDIYYDVLIDNYKIINWSYNRKPASERIPLIKKSLVSSNKVDGEIYLYYINENTLGCYDGIHRLTALQELYKNGFKNRHRLRLNILPEENYEFIKKKFIDLNRSISVPFINSNISNLINDILKDYKNKYGKFFSGFPKPNIPNENETTFCIKLENFINNISLEEQNIFNIINILVSYNNYIKNNYKKLKTIKISKKQEEKCIKHQFFVFINKNWDADIINLYSNKIIQ